MLNRNTPAPPIQRKWLPFGLLALAFLYLALTVLARTINDNDFYWHIKTGQWILENGALPGFDPFAYTTSKQLDFTAIFTLKCYWLAQIIYAGMYDLAGFFGIYLVRVLILAGIVISLYWRQDRQAEYSPVITAFFLMVLCSFFPFERPQAFSFLFFSLLVLLLDDYLGARRLKSRTAYLALVILTTVLWANMHGGFILAGCILVMYAGLETGKVLVFRDKTADRDYAFFLLICAAGLAACFAHPNYDLVHKAVYYLFFPENDWRYQFNGEYRSALTYYQTTGNLKFALLAAFALLSIPAALLRLKSRDFATAIMILLMGYMAYHSIRYIPFYLLAALPAVGSLVSLILRRLPYKPVLQLALLAALVVLSRSDWPNFSNRLGGEWISPEKYPVKVAHFVKENNISGNMYNSFDWGGYLMWELGPERQVFNDGRMLDNRIYTLSLFEGNPNQRFNGQPIWQDVFDRYAIDYAIVPEYNVKIRQRQPLALALERSPTWRRLYSNQNASLYVRRR